MCLLCVEGVGIDVGVCVFLAQIWTMLPGFCTKPTDLVASFKGIARSLGMAITEYPELRMCIYQALRTLIYKSCETGRCGHLSEECV